MKNHFSFFQIQKTFVLILLTIILISPSASMAFMDEADREKPIPEFMRKGDVITAKLVPRAKSNSITIDFQVTGRGTLSAVNAFDLNKALIPEINAKDFRSDLFSVDIKTIAPGEDATLTVASAFFSSSTSYRIFNEHLATPWMDSQAENNPAEKKIQKFVIHIKDGGPFDSDGAANGRITVIGGPSDSFWGYVLGTLFIRFFGVVIVLGVLMAGLMLSGFAFQKLEKKTAKTQPTKLTATSEPIKAEEQYPANLLPKTDEIPLEMAAAIAVAISLHQSPPPRQKSSPEKNSIISASWGVEGRRQIMADRRMVHNRIKTG